MGLFASSLFARELDYNYLADSDEAIIYPMVWKNTVANEASLSGITRLQDGEVRKATDTGYWFQYSANTGLWVKIDKKVSDNNACF